MDWFGFYITLDLHIRLLEIVRNQSASPIAGFPTIVYPRPGRENPLIKRG